MKIAKKAEEFSEKKLRASLRKAGAVPKAVKAAVEAVRSKIRKRTVKTTTDIKRTVGAVLKKLDPRAHKKYMHHKKKK